MASRYEYVPLKPASRETRLLEFIADEATDQIRVRLIRADLDQLSARGGRDGAELNITYTALSYVWGAAENPVDIYIHNDDTTLSITQNLAQALQHLRHRADASLLWVDAICINQADEQERSRQVSLMCDIYRSATTVLVWLGADENNDGACLDYLDFIGSRVDYDWVLSKLRPNELGQADHETHLADISEPLAYDPFPSLYSLLSRPWFDRLWIRQEIFLAKRAIVVCGDTEISYETFRTAIACAQSKGFRNESNADQLFYSLLQRLKFVFDLLSPNLIGLPTLRHKLQYCNCTDPRDRIYGVLGLITGLRDIPIMIDYTLPVSEVYRGTVIDIIKHTNSLDILCSSELQGISSLPDLPSWVPDWPIPPTTSRSLNATVRSCTATFKAYAEPVGHQILRVAGIVTMPVRQATVSPIAKDPSVLGIANGIRETLKGVTLEADYVGGGSIAEAYCRTLCCGIHRDSYDPPIPGESSVQECQEAFEWILNGEGKCIPPKSESLFLYRYTRRCWIFGSGRSLLVTEEGRLGIVPQATQQGDQVAFLLGCSAPLILRPVAGSSRHKIVGQCYIDGQMMGEAIYGPLPSHCRPMSRQAASGGRFHDGFFNEDTGEFRMEHPSSDLVKKKLGVRSERDITIEQLKSLGVPIRYIDLE
ncbi:heterokaryon incompatibility protein-domain-containing protein [Xylariales sp. AK1849]|nr:heterokaryon incompatibility protein-domain-containing protein [Xylariales sp. AK1849]